MKKDADRIQESGARARKTAPGAGALPYVRTPQRGIHACFPGKMAFKKH